MTILSPESRAAIVAGLVETGAPRDRASIAVDMAAHACDQAVETFLRSLRGAPDNLTGFVAVEIGTQLVTHQMGKTLKSIRDLGKSLGLRTGSMDVEVKA